MMIEIKFISLNLIQTQTQNMFFLLNVYPNQLLSSLAYIYFAINNPSEDDIFLIPYSILLYILQMKSGKNQNVDYILINLMPHATSPPSFQKALQHRSLYSAIGRNKGQSNIRDAFTFRTSVFKKYGSGVYLYFNLIKMLFFTFLLMSFTSIPLFLSNFKGDGLTMYGENSLAKALMRLSLGNQRKEHFQTILTNQSVRFDIYVSQIIVIMVDFLNSFIFFVFLIYWKIKSDRTVQELISEDALPSYYTLEVKNLPLSYNQQSMRDHFSKFGAQIAQISTVYNYQNVLSQIKNLIKMVDQFAGSKIDKRAQIYDQIGLQLQKLRNLTKFKTPKPAVSLITFQDMIMRRKIRELYRYQICPRQLQYQGNMIKVSSCRNQPSSILWQNYHLQSRTQVRQSILISIILTIVLLLALLALFLANAHATSMIEKQSAFSLKFDYKKQYSFQEAKKIGTTEAIFVFCSKLTYHDISFQNYYFCEPYFSAYKQKFGYMIGLSLLVVSINVILNWIICQLANFRRYKTKTEKSRFLILNIFSLYFINSGLLMLLIRVELGGYSLGRFIQSIVSLPVDQFSLQSYPDFTRKWYMNIGSQIVMIYAVSLLTSPFIQIFLNWFQAKYRQFKAKRAKTQFQMNQTLIDSQFDFQTFYAMMLNACFFTMFHGNAFPILYLLAVGAFFVLYLASYVVFRYFSCKPVMFDHTLNAVISRVMCISLIFHQITSILYIHTQDIFPLDIVHKEKDESQNQGDVLLHKLHQGLFYIFLGGIFIACTINYNRVCRIVKKYFYRYFVDVQQKIESEPKPFNEVFYEPSEIRTISTEQMINRNRKSDYLSSYKMQDNQNYVYICYALKILSIFEPYFADKSINESHIERKTNRMIETKSQMRQQIQVHFKKKNEQLYGTGRQFFDDEDMQSIIF